MKNEKLILLVVGVVLFVLVTGYFLVKVIYSERTKVNTNQHIIDTWSTERGDEKLIISKGSLIYIDESIVIEDTCTYVEEQCDDVDEFVLYPKKDNEMGILGPF